MQKTENSLFQEKRAFVPFREKPVFPIKMALLVFNFVQPIVTFAKQKSLREEWSVPFGKTGKLKGKVVGCFLAGPLGTGLCL